ncbi:hypothetical protein [Serratia bockelmannii]|uniref:hypothetical protein n=1 Tax=Serratia bockelmannii TaxID=2703793 RepID=UPI003CF71B2A
MSSVSAVSDSLAAFLALARAIAAATAALRGSSSAAAGAGSAAAGASACCAAFQSCTTHPFRKKRLLALFSHLHHRNLNPLLSRFNTTPIVIPLFSERLYVLARLLIRCELRGNACFFNSLNNRCANMKISADFSRSFRYFV